MSDAVHHLLSFSLDLLAGEIETDVSAGYIHSLEWYGTMPEILAGEVEDGVASGGEGGKALRCKSILFSLLCFMFDLHLPCITYMVSVTTTVVLRSGFYFVTAGFLRSSEHLTT